MPYGRGFEEKVIRVLKEPYERRLKRTTPATDRAATLTQRKRLEEFPDGARGVQILTGFADDYRRQILRATRPSVAASFDHIHDDLRLTGAARPCLSLNVGAVGNTLRKIGNRWRRRDRVVLAPEPRRGF